MVLMFKKMTPSMPVGWKIYFSVLCIGFTVFGLLLMKYTLASGPKNLETTYRPLSNVEFDHLTNQCHVAAVSKNEDGRTYATLDDGSQRPVPGYDILSAKNVIAKAGC
jgi:hypothetical protein